MVVPMRIRSLEAAVLCDVASGTAFAEAVLSYELGRHEGCPFFDLRQEIDHAWLDGRALPTAALAPRDVGEGPAATVRVVGVEQQASSRHTLRLRYRVGTPRANLGGAYPPVLAFARDGRMRWSVGMADLYPGRHLEAWFPANLPFDRFPFRLRLRIVGTARTHELITNGDARGLGGNAWSVEFPSWFSGMSPLLEVRPADEVRRASGSALLPASGRTVEVEAWKPASGPEDLPAAVRRIGALIAENEARFGPFPAARFVAFFHGAQGGMEYAGATTTALDALAHEVLHAWFARGVTPASHADGWWDEAFTTYRTSDAGPLPFDWAAPPVRLCSRRPFQRRTPEEAYGAGARFFRGVAALVGPGSLDALMRSLYEAHVRSPLATATLEEHLVAGAGAGAARLVDAFHRFVYGLPEPVSAPALRVTMRHRACEWDPMTPGQVDGSGREPAVHLRVTNESAAQACPHFVVVLTARAASAESPRHHEDVPPPGASVAAAGFDLAPGRSRVVSMPCPQPPPGAREAGLLACVYARGLRPARVAW